MDEVADAEDEPDGWEGDGEGDGAEAAAAAAAAAGAGAALDAFDVPPPFQLALTHGVLAKLLQRCVMASAAMQALSESIPEAETQAIITSVSSIGTTALGALNNIVLLLPAAALGDLRVVWAHAVELCVAVLPAHDALTADEVRGDLCSSLFFLVVCGWVCVFLVCLW